MKLRMCQNRAHPLYSASPSEICNSFLNRVIFTPEKLPVSFWAFSCLLQLFVVSLQTERVDSAL